MTKMKILSQIGIVLGICLVAELIAEILPVAFPASVISMILLFVLLLLRVIKPQHIKEKSSFLQQNMAFFFIPAGVGIMSQYEFIKNSILPLLIICILTTLITFAVTAITAGLIIKLQEKLKQIGR